MISIPSSLHSYQPFTEIESMEFDRLIHDDLGGTESSSQPNDVSGHRGCAMVTSDAPRSKAVQLHQVQHAPKTPTQETLIREAVETEFLKSGYPVQNVRCHCNESTLVLRGDVCRYHYLQIAMKIASRLCGDRRIQNDIKVFARLPDSARQVVDVD